MLLISLGMAALLGEGRMPQEASLAVFVSCDLVTNPAGLVSNWCGATFVAKAWFAF
jgi:hypothetical protein